MTLTERLALAAWQRAAAGIEYSAAADARRMSAPAERGAR